jgi:hypothetical protein
LPTGNIRPPARPDTVCTAIHGLMVRIWQRCAGSVVKPSWRVLLSRRDRPPQDHKPRPPRSKHGQNQFVDSKSNIVSAKFSSQPDSLGVENVGLAGTLARALRQELADGERTRPSPRSHAARLQMLYSGGPSLPSIHPAQRFVILRTEKNECWPEGSDGGPPLRQERFASRAYAGCREFPRYWTVPSQPQGFNVSALSRRCPWRWATVPAVGRRASPVQARSKAICGRCLPGRRAQARSAARLACARSES